MKLYRAVKSSYLKKGLKEGEGLSSLVGKSISNTGQTSTSPLYDSSFASLDEYDSVFEIYTPKGSRGSYIAELSAYDKTEQVVDSNNMKILWKHKIVERIYQQDRADFQDSLIK